MKAYKIYRTDPDGNEEMRILNFISENDAYDWCAMMEGQNIDSCYEVGELVDE